MKDQDKLYNENNSPVKLPAADEAWEAMRKLLDENQPPKPAVIESSEVSKIGFKRIAAILLILLLSAVSYFVWEKNQIKNTGDDNNREQRLNDGLGNRGLNEKENVVAKKVIEDVIPVEREKNKKEANDNKPGFNPIYTTGSQNPDSLKKKSVSRETNNTLEESINEKAANRDLENNTQLSGNAFSFDTGKESPAAILNDSSNAVTAIKNSLSQNSKDSSAANLIDEPIDNKWRLEAGLFWTVPLAINSDAGAWLMGPNGKAQPYRLLLPGAWIQARHEKHIMTFEINPFTVGLPENKSFSSVTTNFPGTDTLMKTYTSLSMSKSFGVSALFGYQYNIYRKWWAGGNVQPIFWTRAVEHTGIVYEKIPSGNPGSFFSAESYDYPMKENWRYFSKFQFMLNADAMYRTKNWQAGLRAGVSLTPFAQNDGPRHPFKTELYFRWRIFYIEKKISEGN